MSQHWRTIHRAALIAAFNGWSIAVCAVISLIIAASSFGLIELLIAIALGVIAYNEFRGRRRLLNLDPSACALLGWNQFGFMLLIVAYCGWRLWKLYYEPQMPLEYPGPMISRNDWDLVVELIVPILIVTYVSIILATILAQGGNAIYYFTRRRHVLARLSELQHSTETPSGITSHSGERHV
jgi:hypothetical protein